MRGLSSCLRARPSCVWPRVGAVTGSDDALGLWAAGGVLCTLLLRVQVPRRVKSKAARTAQGAVSPAPKLELDRQLEQLVVVEVLKVPADLGTMAQTSEWEKEHRPLAR